MPPKSRTAQQRAAPVLRAKGKRTDDAGGRSYKQMNDAMTQKERKLYSSLFNLFDESKYDECVEHCDKLLALLPGHPDALCLKGISLTYMRSSKALRFFSAEELGAAPAQYLKEQGWALIEQAMQAAGTDTHIPYHIAAIVRRSECDYEAARRYFKTASDISKLSATILRDYATVCFLLRQYEECADVLGRLLPLVSLEKQGMNLRVCLAALALVNAILARHDKSAACTNMLVDTIQASCTHACFKDNKGRRTTLLRDNLYHECWQELASLRLFQNGEVEQAYGRKKALQHLAEIEAGACGAEKGETPVESASSSPPYEQFTRKDRRMIAERRFQLQLRGAADTDTLFGSIAELYAMNPHDLAPISYALATFLHAACKVTIRADAGNVVEVLCRGVAVSPEDYRPAVRQLYALVAGLHRGSADVAGSALAAQLAGCLSTGQHGFLAATNKFLVGQLLMSLAILAGDPDTAFDEIALYLASTCPAGRFVSLGAFDPVKVSLKLLERSLPDACASVSARLVAHLAKPDSGVSLVTRLQACTYLAGAGDAAPGLLQALLRTVVALPDTDLTLAALPDIEYDCPGKGYLNDNAAPDAVEAHAKWVAAHKTPLLDECGVAATFADDVEVLVAACDALAVLGLSVLAAKLAYYTTFLDDNDRFLASKAARHLLTAGATQAAVNLHGRFMFKSDPWLNSMEMQDTKFLSSVAETHNGAAGTAIDASSIDEAMLVSWGYAMKASREIIETAWEQCHDLGDFHLYSLRKGELAAYRDLSDCFSQLVLKRPAVSRAVQSLFSWWTRLLALSSALSPSDLDRVVSCLERATASADTLGEECFARLTANDKTDSPERLKDGDIYSLRMLRLLLLARSPRAAPSDGQEYHKVVWVFREWAQANSGEPLAAPVQALACALSGSVIAAVATIKKNRGAFEADVLGAIAHLAAAYGLKKTPPTLLEASRKALDGLAL